MNNSLARTVFGCLGALLLMMLAGCLGARDWQYPPLSTGAYLDVKASKPINAKVAVLPFEDLRGNTVKEEYWKAAVPLMLYGETEYDRPEKAENPEKVDVVRFDPAKDFAEAAASELREAGIFSSVVFANGEQIPPTELILRGRLRSTNWGRRLYTYLMGPLGTIFWIVGIPMGETSTAVGLDLRLTPASDPSKVVWSMSMKYDGKKWDSPYYNLEDAVQSYPGALQEALKPAISDLVQLVQEDPGRLYSGN